MQVVALMEDYEGAKALVDGIIYDMTEDSYDALLVLNPVQLV